jgi:hypothetical protein
MATVRNLRRRVSHAVAVGGWRVAVMWAVGCGGSDDKGKSGAGKGKSTATKTHALPGDIQKLKIVYSELNKLAIRTAKVDAPVRIRIPMGTYASREGASRPSLIVQSDLEFTVQPGSGANARVGFEALLLHRADWGKQKRDQKLVLSPAKTDTPEYKYIAAADKRKKEIHWIPRQLGLWALLDDVPVKKLTGLAVRTSNAFGAEGVSGVYSYNSVKPAREIFRAIGKDPQKYQLFRQNRERFENDLGRYRMKGPDVRLTMAQSGNRFGPLAEYKGEPAVEKLLLAYISAHEDPDYRRDAHKQLCRIGGMSGTIDELYKLAAGVERRVLRLTAIRSLLDRKDARAVPLLLAHEYDGYLLRDQNTHFRGKRREATKVDPKPHESLLAYWARTGGWDEVAKAHGDAAQLRAAVGRIQLAEQAFMDAEIQPITSDDPRRRDKAFGEAHRRFGTSPRVFERLCAVARGNNNQAVRIEAMKALSHFQHTFDLHDLVTDRLANDASDKVKAEALRVRSSPDPAKRRAVFAQVARHGSEEIRLAATKQLDAKDIDPATEATLATMATKDASGEVRIAAIGKLRDAKSSKLLSVFRDVLGGKDPGYRAVAKRVLLILPGSLKGKEGYELLQKTAVEHPEKRIRYSSLIGLGRYVKDFPAAGFALERLRKDTDPTVQSGALLLAVRILHGDRKHEAAGKVVAFAMTHESEKIRIQAVKAVGQLRLGGMDAAVVSLAKGDKIRAVREAARGTLKRLKSPQYLAVLKAWLTSEDAEDRRAAVRALTSDRDLATKPETATLLEPLKNDPDESVQFYVQRYFRNRK